jgi:hypothetical protein
VELEVKKPHKKTSEMKNMVMRKEVLELEVQEAIHSQL